MTANSLPSVPLTPRAAAALADLVEESGRNSRDLASQAILDLAQHYRGPLQQALFSDRSYGPGAEPEDTTP
jgi:hypothetical protein